MQFQRVKHIIRDAIIFFFCFVFRYGRALPAILLYHSVSPQKHWLSLSPEAFEAHIIRLRETGHIFVSLTDIEKKRLLCDGKKYVAMTFDDGFEDNYIYAVPLLKKYHIPATFFVSTNYIGTKNEKKEFDCMPWEQLVMLANDPLFSIASHAQSHSKFPFLSASEAQNELDESKSILEKGIHTPVTAFAFPYGLFLREHRFLVKKAGYLIAVTCERRRLRATDHALELPRYVVDRESVRFVSYMTQPGYELYWRLYQFFYTNIIKKIL